MASRPPSRSTPRRPIPAAQPPVHVPGGDGPAHHRRGLELLREPPAERGEPEARRRGALGVQGVAEPVLQVRQGLGLARVRYAHEPLRPRL
eukprot:8193100-Pyramimonas_sp.AAC.1